MKSKQQEVNESKVKTNCADCLFAVYDGKTQTGCLHGRVEKFGDSAIEATDNDRNFFVIKRACSLFRPLSWNEGDADIKKAREQITLRFSILVNCDTITPELEERTLSSIESIDYDKDKIQIVLAQVDGDRHALLSMYSRLESSGFKPIVMTSVHNLAREVHGFTKTSVSSFVTKINLGDEVSDCLSEIDSIINDDLKAPVLIENGEQQWVLFMILNMNYLEYNDYDEFLSSLFHQAITQSKYIKINEKK